mmetsp:Transcript_63907/g.57506  ORF Transcript_63907/g.57506 Transcript_63907/m.57506 type:complete len:118 (+) Transcript_63907:97-450(+)
MNFIKFISFICLILTVIGQPTDEQQECDDDCFDIQSDCDIDCGGALNPDNSDCVQACRDTNIECITDCSRIALCVKGCTDTYIDECVPSCDPDATSKQCFFDCANDLSDCGSECRNN